MKVFSIFMLVHFIRANCQSFFQIIHEEQEKSVLTNEEFASVEKFAQDFLLNHRAGLRLVTVLEMQTNQAKNYKDNIQQGRENPVKLTGQFVANILFTSVRYSARWTISVQEPSYFHLNLSFLAFNFTPQFGCHTDNLIILENTAGRAESPTKPLYLFCGKRYPWLMFLQCSKIHLWTRSSKESSFQLFYQVMSSHVIKDSFLCDYFIFPPGDSQTENFCKEPTSHFLHTSVANSLLPVSLINIKIPKYCILFVEMSTYFDGMQVFDGPTADSKELSVKNSQFTLHFSGFQATFGIVGYQQSTISDVSKYFGKYNPLIRFQNYGNFNFLFSTRGRDDGFYFQAAWFRDLLGKDPLEIKVESFHYQGVEEEVEYDRFGGVAIYYIDKTGSVKEVLAAKHNFRYYTRGKTSLFEAISETDTKDILIVFYSYMQYSQHVASEISIRVSSCFASYQMLELSARPVCLLVFALNYHFPEALDFLDDCKNAFLGDQISSNNVRMVPLLLNNTFNCLKTFFIERTIHPNISTVLGAEVSEQMLFSGLPFFINFFHQSQFQQLSIMSHFLDWRNNHIYGDIVLLDLFSKSKGPGAFLPVKPTEFAPHGWTVISLDGYFALNSVSLRPSQQTVLFLLDAHQFKISFALVRWFCFHIRPIDVMDKRRENPELVSLLPLLLPSVLNSNNMAPKSQLKAQGYHVYSVLEPASHDVEPDSFKQKYAFLNEELAHTETFVPTSQNSSILLLVHFNLTNCSHNTTTYIFSIHPSVKQLVLKIPCKKISLVMPTTVFPVCSIFWSKDLTEDEKLVRMRIFFTGCQAKFKNTDANFSNPLHFEFVTVPHMSLENSWKSIHYCFDLHKECFEKFISWNDALRLCREQNMSLPEIFGNDDLHYVERHVKQVENDISGSLFQKRMTSKLYQTMAIYIGLKYQVQKQLFSCWVRPKTVNFSPSRNCKHKKILLNALHLKHNPLLIYRTAGG